MNRSELKRTPFAKIAKPPAGPKQIACKNRACRKRFVPPNPFIRHCSLDCGLVLGLEAVAKRAAAKAKAERAADKKKRRAMMSIPELKAEAQTVFNKFVRERDLLAGHGCICCGKFATAAALAQPGGAYDACHYRSRGSADHLRYDERNCHLGLKDCNTYGHMDYRGGLIRRIGLEAVEALESDHSGRKWTREYLEGIKATYAAKLKVLKGNQ